MAVANARARRYTHVDGSVRRSRAKGTSKAAVEIVQNKSDFFWGTVGGGRERERRRGGKNAEKTGTRYRIDPIDATRAAATACKRAKNAPRLSGTHGCTTSVQASLL